MLRRLTYLPYSLLLLFSQLPFLLAVFWDYCKHLKNLILISCVLGLIGLSATLPSLTTHPTSQTTVTPKELEILTKPRTTMTQYAWTKNEVENEINSLLFLEQQQTSNQEILYSLAALYAALGETSNASSYLTRAHQLNPNSTIFSEN